MISWNADIGSYREGVSKATEIFDEYGDFIYSIIRCQTGNDAQADDLFQDFFLSVAFNPPPADVRNIRGYLYKAIIHDVVDAVRRVEKYQSRVHRYADGVKMPAAKDKPENILIVLEETNKMFELIKLQLPRSEAEAITLRYKGGHNITEVAEKMDVNTRTISRYISVGLSKVRQILRIQEHS